MNLKLSTTDNVTLGSWFVLSEPFYQTYRASSTELPTQPSLEVIRTAMRTYPTILYCHGTAATRAAPARMHHYSSFSSRLRANILVLDYRGFGDSEGTPSEAGLAEDAQTAWRWLMEQGAKPEDIMLIGHSLGTGVVTSLATHLAREDLKPRGVALLAPFTNLATLVETYSIRGIPILQPLQAFSFGRSEFIYTPSWKAGLERSMHFKFAELIKTLLRHEFDTLSKIQDINVPVLLAHSQDDMDIPYHHARTLLDKLLDPHLPEAISLPATPNVILSKEDYQAYVEAEKQRRTVRSQLVRKTELPSFGTVEEFDGAAGKVVYVETFWGKHDQVGLQEGIQDVIASTFRLGHHL